MKIFPLKGAFRFKSRFKRPLNLEFFNKIPHITQFLKNYMEINMLRERVKNTKFLSSLVLPLNTFIKIDWV
jgi:hypothetical protein